MTLKRIFRSPTFIKIIFVLSLFLIIFVAGIGYKHITDLTKSSDAVNHTYKLNIELEQILSYIKDAETGQRGFMITGDSLYLEPYLNGRIRVNNSFAELKALTDNDSIQQKNLKELSILIDNRLDNFEVASKYALNHQTELKRFKDSFFQGKAYMDGIREKLNDMIAIENERLLQLKSKNDNVLSNTPILLYSLVLMTLLLIYFSYVRINSNLENLKRKNQQLEIFKKASKQSEIINKVGSWRWHVEDDVFQFSDNLFRLLGEEPNAFEQTTENFMKHVHPEDVPKLTKQIEQMHKDEDLPFVYFRVVHSDGSIHHLKSFGKAVKNEDGEVQLLGTTTDITNEIDNMHLLEKRNQELELNNKELEAFNYVASHDLQEPLRKIQTFLSRLEDKEEDNLTDSGKLYIERINDAATRMRQLIDDLLQFSRTNKSNEVLKSTDINQLLENAQEDLAESIVKHNVKITAEKLPNAKVIPFQIQQLFTNLIGNSIKYAAADRSPEINILYKQVNSKSDEKLDTSNKTKYHKITFTDNGIGFSKEYEEQIFVLFSRLHNKDEYSGTGIGLSICKKIMDNHSGYIFATGKPGIGAEFSIYLPI